METNFFGPMRMARAFAPVLRDNGGGALVNVLSVLSFISMPQGATYSASKAAAWSLTNALRIELRRQGTLVVAVHAGFIDTDMAAGVSAREDQPAIGRNPDRRGHRSRRRGGPRRSHQRDGEGGAAQRPDGAVPRPAGPVGRRSDQPMIDATWKEVPTRAVDVGGVDFATTTSAANVELVESLGADIVIDYKTQDFEAILDHYDVVLHSQDATTLDKSLRVLKPGGRLISISGPPDPAFGDEIGAPWFVKPVLRAGSASTRRRAKRLGVGYSFLFMRANGTQLTEITSLIDAGIIHPVLDRVFPFASTNEAIAYVESGRAKGKVVVTLR